MNNKKVRVLNIITRLDAGGSSDVALAITGRLNNGHFECALLYGHTADPDGSIQKHISDNKINAVNVRSLVRELNPLKDLAAFLQIYKFIKRNDFDIVHTHSSKAGLIGRWAAYFAGVKHIIYMPHGHVFYGYYGKLLSFVFVIAERLSAVITEKIIALTPRGINDHLAYKIASADKFVSIHPGVDLAPFSSIKRSAGEMKAEIGISEDTFVIGSVTRLERVKNNELLLRAFALVCEKYPNTALVIAGEGSERKMLETLAGELKVSEKVKFLGFRKDIPALMNMFDIFALASRNEGFGKVFVQAAAIGKAVVATRVGGVESVVLDGKTGLLAESGDYKSFADKIIELINNRELAGKLGKNALEWAGGKEGAYLRFSEEAMLEKIKNLYEEVLKK